MVNFAGARGGRVGAIVTALGAGGAAMALAGVAVTLLVASGPLFQLRFLSLPAAFEGLRLAAAVGVVASITGAVALIAALHERRAGRAMLAGAAVLASVVAMVIPIRAQGRARSAPAVPDVTTDVAHPPAFKVLAELPDGRRRDLTRAPQLDAVQRRAYPEITSLVVPTQADMAFEETLETLSDLEWQVEDASEKEGRIEASARSGWFGFKDDIVVRLTPTGGGTRVDVRSVARDATTDMGRNAQNVRAFLAEMRR